MGSRRVVQAARRLVDLVPRDDRKYKAGRRLPESEWVPDWDFHRVVESGPFGDAFRELWAALESLDA